MAGGRAAPGEAEELRRDDPLIAAHEAVPTIDEVFRAPVATREVVGDGLFPAVEREFPRCIARAIAFNREDAFDESPAQETQEEEGRRRSRAAWTELFMFSKACTPALPGGKAKEKRNGSRSANKVERWRNGERRGL